MKLIDPPTDRIAVVLNAKGCEFARARKRCTNCAVWGARLPEGKRKLPNAQVLAEALEGSAHSEVDIYTGGSFFNGRELDGKERVAVLRALAGYPHVKRVLVESRPEFVGVMDVLEANGILSDAGKELIVAIGLESSNDYVRRMLVGKRFSIRDFERAAGIIAGAKASLHAYVLQKPLGLSEREAILDSVETLRYLAGLKAKLGTQGGGGKRGRGVSVYAALEPAFVQKGTALYTDFAAGRYQPPWLWSVVEVLRGSAGLRLDGLRVGTPEDFPAPVAIRENRGADGKRCGCSGEVEERIARFNSTRDVSVFDSLSCSCRGIWEKAVRAEPG